MNGIAASTWIWTSPLKDEGLRRLVPHVRALGFDAIELPVEEAGAWDVGLAAELLAGHGLDVSVCGVFPPERDLLGDDEARRRTQDYLRACIDVAVRVGSRVVGGPAYSAVGRLWRLDASGRARELERLVEALGPVVAYAGERGVTLALEPLNRYETSFVNTVDQGLEIVAAVDSPALGLLVDTYHMNIEEVSPADAIRRAGPHVAHVHASASHRGTPGSDTVDWPEVAAAVREIRYEGLLCIEAFSAEVAALAEATRIWRPLAPTPDDLARDGLAFLRRTFA